MAEFIKKQVKNLIYYVAPQLDGLRGVSHGFFTRTGGVSREQYSSLNFRFNSNDSYENVVKNHIIAGSVLGALPQNIVCTRQQHTDNIRILKGEYSELPDDAAVDAIVTDVPGLCLTAYYADCQAVMMVDPRKRVAAIVHAGWRGVENGIVAKTVETIGGIWNVMPENLIVAIGPSICRSCFETDRDVPERLSAAYNSYAAEYIYKDGDKWHIDLRNITYRTLLQLGVHPTNIDISNICPTCTHEKELWWSHRRHEEERGVQGAMLMLK